MKGFLLAAGFGTRLWPLSDVRAKPAFPHRGKALIAGVAEHMHSHGVREIWINTHHLPESIDRAIDPVRTLADIHLVHEPTILGTAGAIVNIRKAVRDEPLLIMNAKVVTTIDLRAVIDAHERSGAPVTMVCVPNATRDKFTHVDFASDGTLNGFVPGEDLARVEKPYVFTGIQVLSPAFYDFLPPPGFSDTIKDVYPRIQAAKHRINVVAMNERWEEFSTLARYRDLHGDGYVDPRATVERGATLERTVVWENARIGAGAVLRGCIVADGVEIPDGARLENMAVIQASRVKAEKPAQRLGPLLLAEIA